MKMLKIRQIKVAAVVVLVMAVSLGLAAWTQAQSTAPSAEGQHCVVHLEPVSRESEISKATHLGCYETFEEAISVATDGTVKLPSGISPSAVTDELLGSYGMGSVPTANVAIGSDYDDVGFSGLLGTLTWTAAQGCSSSVYYNAPNMPSGWNDRVSSARSYSDCNKYYHYEHTNYGGTSITCNMGQTCSSMGVMNNKTSSEKWRY